MLDTDIVSMIYWDKNTNGSYYNGTDRGIITSTYAIDASGHTGYPYYLVTPFTTQAYDGIIMG